MAREAWGLGEGEEAPEPEPSPLQSSDWVNKAFGIKECCFDLNIVEESRFQSSIGFVILGSVFVLWGETDHPDMPFWTFIDSCLLIVFIVEFVLRLLAHQEITGFFTGEDKWWAYLDALCICLGMCDTWVMPCLTWQLGSDGLRQDEIHDFVVPLRMVRLLRLLRVFKMFKQLMLLIKALREIIGTAVWIFAVLCMFLLTFAVPLTHLLGHFEAFSDPQLRSEHSAALATIRGYFGDVPTSLFTLFQLTTIDNWDEVSDPLVEISPWWRVFFVMWMAVCSWTMFAVLTAVASHKMVNATADRKERELREQERKQVAFIEFLRESFVQGDLDGNGVLDYDEFTAMISSDMVLLRMKELGLHMTIQELLAAWEMLDADESGELTIEEFVDGLSTLQEGLATKHIVGVDYAMKRMKSKSETKMMNVQTMAEEAVQESTKRNDKVINLGNNDIEQDMELWSRWQANSDFGTWLKRQHAVVAGK